MVTEPDGVNDTSNSGQVTIAWATELPGAAEGVVSLFYDTDDSGGDGTPIATGFDARGEVSTYTWDPSGLEAGSYAVYAVLDWTGGSETAYGAFVQVTGSGCACVSLSRGDKPSDFLLCGSTIVILAAGFRRRKTRRRESPVASTTVSG